ncbi:cyanophycinase [Fibrella forsythiae]|uniref:Cyanophycinase n=1 Tax=Fibrella forsythiae TaxID=2817061 RepID=A0ABS3JH16_9BACT|nr:cyanophycinase [Fibrella forsythiae]MBO0949297.1 cyanophycinase [Fibrella forsythiae]
MSLSTYSFSYWLACLWLLAAPAAYKQQTTEPVCVSTAGPTTWLTGDAADVTTSTTPGILLAGGSTDVAEAMRWFLKKSGGGDVVILRASGSDGYNTYLYTTLGETVNSVETILLNSAEWVNDEAVVQKIRNAEALFIAGGDQGNYVKYWKDSKVETAINYLINSKKVPVGGTSAGCAVLGQIYYPAFNESLTSAEALSDPYHANLMLGRNDFIDAPFMANTITDTHFAQRNRQGRLVAFLARMRTDWNVTGRGIGVSEKTAVGIEPTGMATVFGSGVAYFVTPASSGKPEQCVAGKPLVWSANKKAICVAEVQSAGTFNLKTWTAPDGKEPTYWSVTNEGFQTMP